MSGDFRRHIPVALNLDLKSMGSFYQFNTFRIKSVKFVDILDFSVTEVAIDNLACISLGKGNEYRSALIDKNSLIFTENDKVYLKLGRDEKNYKHSDEEVLEKYGEAILMYERMPDLYSAAMGNRMYTAKFKDKEVMDEFIKFVHETV